MWKRIYQYAADHPEDGDLIFKQFIELTKVFTKESDVAVDEQRMDSTMISANIKNAGRLALAFDVLEQALKALPEELLTESQKEVLGDGYRNKLLYKCKGNQVVSKLQEILDTCSTVLDAVSNKPEILDLNAIKVLKRFIDEQTDLNEDTGSRIAKANKSIKANSLQSAYDEDATYRKKAKKEGKGYVVNITDYDVEPNIASDVDFAKDRIPVIKTNFELSYNCEKDLVNAHFSKEVCDNCEFKNRCCVDEQVKAYKFSTTWEAIETQNKREEIKESIKENSSKRTAIEGTNSELKRSHGLNDVEVKGIIKVTITTGMKITACNFKRFAKNAIENLTKKPVLPNGRN